MEPAIYAVGAPKSALGFIGLSTVEGMLPTFDHHRPIGFMDEPRPILKLVETDAQIVEEPTIGEIDLSGGRHRLHQRWNGVQNQAQIPFGSSRGLLGRLSVVDVGSDGVPPSSVTIVVTRT